MVHGGKRKVNENRHGLFVYVCRVRVLSILLLGERALESWWGRC